MIKEIAAQSQDLQKRATNRQALARLFLLIAEQADSQYIINIYV